MHIMHLLESLEFGGAEKVVVHLANKFSDSNEVSVCVTKKIGELVSELNSNIKVYCLNSPEGNNIRLPEEIKELIVKNNVDIVHSHNWGIYIDAALAIRKIKTTRLIHTIHGPYLNYTVGIKSLIKIKLRHLAELFFSRYADKIVVVSESIKKYINADIGIKNESLQVIHNGIVDIGNKENTKKIDIKIRFITVGRLAKIKNQMLLLAACKKMLINSSNFHLSFVGDGPEMDNLVKYCNENGLQDNVSFFGFRTDVVALLQENDVFLLSSKYEGISIALLESMSLSMPSIATNVGGIPDTVNNNETGFLVPSGDVDTYAEKLQNFIDKPELVNEMGKKSRECFVNKFHEDVVIKEYKILYENCMRRI